MAKPKFFFPEMEKLYEAIPEQYKEVFEWLYETSRIPELAIVMLGSLCAEGVLNPDIKFWDALVKAKDHFEKNLKVEAVKVKEDKVETVH